MSGVDLTAWLDAYLAAFAACGRGERDAAELAEFYAPPVLLSNDDAAVILADEAEFLGWAQAQIDGMKAADFDHIDVLDRTIEPVNATTTLVRGSFSRHRRDGSEISRLTATYVVVTRDGTSRIAALMLHSTT